MASKAFARVADALRKEFGVKSHVNSNRMTIVVWEDGQPHTITVEQKRFKEPS